MSVYSSLDMPSRSLHLWKYTSWKRMHPTGNVSEVPLDLELPKFSISLIDGDELPKGIKFEKATNSDYEVFPNSVDFEEGNVSPIFLKEMLCDNIYKLTVDKGVVLEKPILLSMIFSGKISGLHILLDIGENSIVELVNKFEGDCKWVGLMREGVVGRGSIFNDVFINNLSEESVMLRVEGVEVSRDTQVKSGTLAIGGTRNKSDIRFQLTGKGSSLSVNGSTLGQGDTHEDSHVEIVHAVGNNQSRLFWHSVCDDNSNSIGTGMLKIMENASGSDAGQLFHNLLLSPNASADSIPELEVLNDDVAAAHGTANGPIDKNHQFYLESRGHSKKEAKALIVESFLNESLLSMGSVKLVEHVTDCLVDKLATK